MALPEIDYTSLTDAEVTQLKLEALAEEDRRLRVAQAPIQAESLSMSYLQDVGRVSGAAWVQPQGAHDCYPVGYVVRHLDADWESLIPANVWAPGSDPTLWKDLTPTSDLEAWDPNSKLYLVADEVTYENDRYRCLQQHTSQAGWTPVAVPALWQMI